MTLISNPKRLISNAHFHFHVNTFSVIQSKEIKLISSIANGGIDSFVSGLVNTQCGKLDISIADDLQNNLKDTPDGELFDLAAFNINRGRDHGKGFFLKLLNYSSSNGISIAVRFTTIC